MKDRLCTIYKGSRRQELYLYVDKTDDLENVPAQVVESMGELSRVMTLVIGSDRKLARADAGRVLIEIEEKGFYLQLPPTVYPEKTADDS